MRKKSFVKLRKKEAKKKKEERRIAQLKDLLYEKYLKKRSNKVKKRQVGGVSLEERIKQLKEEEKFIENPIFSLVAAAIRKETYSRIYWHLRAYNNVAFEMVFAGDCPPDEDVSVNFKYLNVNYSVSKCIELAVRESRADYIICMADDVLFTPGCLDTIYTYLKRPWYNQKVVFGFGQKKIGPNKVVTLSLDFLENAPVVSEFQVFERETWMRLGGIDKRFEGAYFNYDLLFRFYENGYILFFIPYIFGMELRQKSFEVKTNLFQRTSNNGFNLIKQIWGKDNKFCCKRLEIVDSFKDEDFLI